MSEPVQCKNEHGIVPRPTFIPSRRGY